MKNFLWAVLIGLSVAMFVLFFAVPAMAFNPAELPPVKRTCVKVQAERAYQWLRKEGFDVQRAIIKQYNGDGAFAAPQDGKWYIGLDAGYRQALCQVYKWSLNPNNIIWWLWEPDTRGMETMFHEYFHQYGDASEHGLVESVAWDMEKRWRLQRSLGSPWDIVEHYKSQVIATRRQSARATHRTWPSRAATRWRINHLKALPQWW